MPGRNYFRDRRSLVAADATYNDLEYGPVRENRRYHITRFAVEAETSAPDTDIRVYIKGHGYEHWLMEQDTPAVDTLYWDTDETFLMMGESLVARFTGTDADDILRLYIEGWWEELS